MARVRRLVEFEYATRVRTSPVRRSGGFPKRETVHGVESCEWRQGQPTACSAAGGCCCCCCVGGGGGAHEGDGVGDGAWRVVARAGDAWRMVSRAFRSCSFSRSARADQSIFSSGLDAICRGVSRQFRRRTVVEEEGEAGLDGHGPRGGYACKCGRCTVHTRLHCISAPPETTVASSRPRWLGMGGDSVRHRCVVRETLRLMCCHGWACYAAHWPPPEALDAKV
jgi:hypothetical protein